MHISPFITIRLKSAGGIHLRMILKICDPNVRLKLLSLMYRHSSAVKVYKLGGVGLYSIFENHIK